MTTSTPRTYGGKTSEERRAERRERFLDAGLELFGTRGYTATTIELICLTAGVNVRYFYEEFRTREALLAAVYDRHVAGVRRDVEIAIHSATDDPLIRLAAGLDAFVRGTLSDERAARVNYLEMLGVSPTLEQVRRDALHGYVELVLGEVSALARAGRLVTRDYRRTAIAFVGATDGLMVDWLTDPDHDASGLDAIITTLVEIFAPLAQPPKAESLQRLRFGR
jgi:AcrR family transcriptional regulator